MVTIRGIASLNSIPGHTLSMYPLYNEWLTTSVLVHMCIHYMYLVYHYEVYKSCNYYIHLYLVIATRMHHLISASGLKIDFNNAGVVSNLNEYLESSTAWCHAICKLHTCMNYVSFSGY